MQHTLLAPELPVLFLVAVPGKWRECSTVFSTKGGKSARNIGIDLADLRKMASEAGDGTPFLVIQAIGKKSILRLTSICLLKKRRGKSAQARSLELPFTNPLISHLSCVISVEVSPHLLPLAFPPPAPVGSAPAVSTPNTTSTPSMATVSWAPRCASPPHRC